MPWHQSKSDPRKVYDSRHETVCVCQNADQAELITRAVNALGPQTEQIKLREPEPSRLTHATSHAEGCCAKHIAKASLSGALDRLQPWECPKCGTTYWPRQEGPVVSWEARAAVMVFKP